MQSEIFENIVTVSDIAFKDFENSLATIEKSVEKDTCWSLAKDLARITEISSR